VPTVVHQLQSPLVIVRRKTLVQSLAAAKIKRRRGTMVRQEHLRARRRRWEHLKTMLMQGRRMRTPQVQLLRRYHK